MSKAKTTEVIDLNLKKKRSLVIIIISILTAAVLVVSIILATYQAPTPTVVTNETPSSDLSALTISNGDFHYTNESSVLYPLGAQGWTKVTGDTESDLKSTLIDSTVKTYSDFVSNVDTSKTVMGIIDTSSDKWESVSNDLKTQGVNLTTNPSSPEDIADDGITLSDENVYMIHNVEKYAASIYSKSFTMSSSTYNKVSVKLKLVGVEGGAFIMIKRMSATTTNSAVENTSTSGASTSQYWFAYKFGITQSVFDAMAKDANGYATFTFYVFNLSSSSSTVYAQVGLGNVYTFNSDNSATEGASGTLLIDEIRKDTCTASDYVAHASDAATVSDKPTYTLPATDTATYLTVADADIQRNTVATYEEYKTDADYKAEGTMPFAGSGTIYVAERNNTADKAAKYLSFNIGTVSGPDTNMCYHITFWMRTVSSNAKAVANIYLVDGNGEEQALKSAVKTEEDVTDDTHNGWQQFHVYVKPANIDSSNVTIKIYLGDKAGYEAVGSGSVPCGKVLVTDFKYEKITPDVYSSKSSSSSNLSYDLSGTSATVTITNGSFNSVITSSGIEVRQPASWTFAYAGQNIFAKDGVNNIVVPNKLGDVDCGVISDAAVAPAYDDTNKSVLKITNNVATSAGFVSSSVSVSAHSYALVTVYAKAVGAAKPYIYLYNTTDHTIIAAYEGDTSLGSAYVEPYFESMDSAANNNGYTKYHFFVATGDKSVSIALVLFNGGLTETGAAGTLQQGTVYYDFAGYSSYGTYTRTYEYTDDDKTAYVYDDNGNVKYTDEDAESLSYVIGEDNGVWSLYDSDSKTYKTYDNVIVTSFKSVLDAPEIETDDDDDTTDDTTTSDIDVGLLFSIISSCLLVCALLIVVVLKLFPVKKKIVA